MQETNQNAINLLNCSEAEVASAESCLERVQEVFYRSTVRLVFNKNAIVVKVLNPKNAEMIQKDFRDMERGMAAFGVSIKVNKGGNRFYSLKKVSAA